MSVDSIEPKSVIPSDLVNCGCGNQGKWEVYPRGFVYGESGRLLWRAFRCRVCGKITIRQT